MGGNVSDRLLIRPATLDDLDRLVRLEEHAFDRDRFSRTQIRSLLTRAHGLTLIAFLDDRLAGSAMVLWRRNNPVARLYSILTTPSFRGRGVGRRLLEAVEEASRKQGCTRMSLEVRIDNSEAIRLYETGGYQVARSVPDYYRDGSDALRMVKRLGGGPGLRLRVPYYRQTTEFSCGAACLMMALKHFDPALKLTRTLELRLWKEATLIYTTSGVGGIGPFGLAVAAARRGRSVHVVLSDRRTPFVASVRRPDKKEVMRLLHREYRREAAECGVQTTYGEFRLSDLAGEIESGMLPIALVSTWRLHQAKDPHWVVITGFDREQVFFHDPYQGFYEKDRRSAQHLALPIKEFDQMRRHSKDLRKAAVLIGP